MDLEKTGCLIAACRHSRGLTQAQLAQEIGVTNRAVSKWERGAGFPDVSLLEPLADALGISVIELIHGQRQAIDTDSEHQVREALQILKAQVSRKLARVFRVVKVLLSVCLVVLLAAWWHWEVSTGGDGYTKGRHRQVTRMSYQSNCASLPTQGIYQADIFFSGSWVSITEPEALETLVEQLSSISVGGTYRDWGPHSLEGKILLYADGWTADGNFIDTQDTVFAYTFPAFSAGLAEEEPSFYFTAEIDDSPAWSVLEPLLPHLPKAPLEAP